MLFYLNENNKNLIKSVKPLTLFDIGWDEKDLENLVSKNITKLIPENQLMVLCQSKPFKEAADIFAVDKEGKLYIFELKRWISNQENVLQVLRYGQIFGQYSYDLLEKMLRSYKQDQNIDLAEKHYEYFIDSIDAQLPKVRFNNDQRFVVITNGTDLKSLNAIKYWQDKNLQLDSIIYRVYKVGDDVLFEFNPYNPEREVLLEKEEGYYIVNTNITWSNVNYKEMLNEEKAAAYYDRKHGIVNINKNDTVFLYHTGIGVVAYGKAISNQLSKDVNGAKDEEFYIKLKFDWKIDPDIEPERAVKPYEINNEMQSGYRFRQTAFTIPEEMAEAIKRLAKNK